MYISASSLVCFALLPAYGIAAPAGGLLSGLLSGGKGGNDNNDSKKGGASQNTVSPANTVSPSVNTVAPVAASRSSPASIPGGSMTENGSASNGPASNGSASNGTASSRGSSTNSSTTVSDKQVANAVVGWMTDTGKVTKFLNTATSFTGDEYTQQATIALNAEIDELNHKAVLDVALDPAAIQSANDTLATQGNFQAVVDSLKAMVKEGPDTAQSRVNEINNNRCVNVLPNINIYFSVAGAPDSSAFVPTGCLEVAQTNPAGVAQNTQVLPSVTGAPNSAPTPASNNSAPRASSSLASNGRTSTSRAASAARSSPTVK